eukprot:7140550-Prorocentrum_lima.AAC.1
MDSTPDSKGRTILDPALRPDELEGRISAVVSELLQRVRSEDRAISLFAFVRPHLKEGPLRTEYDNVIRSADRRGRLGVTSPIEDQS